MLSQFLWNAFRFYHFLRGVANIREINSDFMRQCNCSQCCWCFLPPELGDYETNIRYGYGVEIIMRSASGWITFPADSQNTKTIEVGSIYAGEVNPVLQWTTFSFSECSWHTPPANRKRWPHWWDRWYQKGKGFIVKTLLTGWPAYCCCPRSQKWEHSRWIYLRKRYCEQ